MYLSVIIPVFNEVNTIDKIITKVLESNCNFKEIIIVDDYSTDGTREILKKYENNNLFIVLFHKKNMGKGACIITATKYLSGDYMIIQDADLEYDPNDYWKFFNMLKNKHCDVIYGSRVLGDNYKDLNFSRRFRIFANFILTMMSNIINRQSITDAHTCYKFINVELFKKLKLSTYDFSICVEITTKLSKLGIKINEVPISYSGRTFSEGKKIKFKDAIYAFYTLIKFRYLNK